MGGVGSSMPPASSRDRVSPPHAANRAHNPSVHETRIIRASPDQANNGNEAPAHRQRAACRTLVGASTAVLASLRRTCDARQVTYRDDGDASRARAEALQRQLDERERELEQARKAQEAAERERDELSNKLRTTEKKKPKRSPTARKEPAAADETPPEQRWPWLRRAIMAIGITGAVCGAAYPLVDSALAPVGISLPTQRTPERAVPGCECSLGDGRRVRLGVRVIGTRRMENAFGRPWQWFLTWIAHVEGTAFPLDGGGSPPTGPWKSDDIRVWMACVGDDRLITASFTSVSAYSMRDRRLLWTRDQMLHIPNGRGVACEELDAPEDGVITVPTNDQDDAPLRARVLDGRDPG